MRHLLGILLLVLGTVFAWGVQGSGGPYRVDLVSDPAMVPEKGKITLRITLKDAGGKPVTGAHLRVLTQMPGMPMGEREEEAMPVAGTPGAYTVPAQFNMAGGYDTRITIDGPQGNATVTIPLQTGESTTGESGGFSFVSLIPWLIGIALVAFVLYRMRQTGQTVDARPVFTGQVILTLLIFAAVLAFSIYAVNHYRRPGSMTPLEAQVMDMSSTPPEGVTPVLVATAESRPFGGSVRYSGQAVGYVEQDVVPRVAGTILWMPLYVGDRVARGQLIARLDTTQLDPQVAEKSAGVNTAQQGVGVASMEYQQALQGISEAEAEASTAEGAVQEAKANLDAVREGRIAAQAEVAAAQSEVENARAEVTAMNADRQYWSEEIKRMRSLLASGAVSKDEFQKEKAEADKADAKVSQAEQGVSSAQAKLRAAQSAAKRVEAEIVAAGRKVQQAQAQARAQQAKIRTARSAAAAAKQRIGQSQSGVREAQAMLSGAAAAKGYAFIRSEIDGVVTQRLISPGVLVSPGQAILKIAQVSPIRMQANVPEGDLAKIKVGAQVKIIYRDTSEAPTVARVTSVAPSVDPNARTGVVEAVLPNQDKRFLPGQFVSMEISIGGDMEAVVIPRSAVQTMDVPAGDVTVNKSFVWIAEPVQGQAGRFTVARAEVSVGDTAGDRVAVMSGLKPGQKVVTQGAEGLKPGQMVESSGGAEPVAGAESLSVKVSAAGFSPDTIPIKANTATTITFTRVSEKGCGTEVVFPDLNIRKALPLNQPVRVDLPPQPAGQIRFACGMNMLHGKVVAR